jgi:hypothetical protein
MVVLVKAFVAELQEMKGTSIPFIGRSETAALHK